MGPCCLVGEDGQEVTPSGVLNAFVQARLAAGPVTEIAAVPIGDGRGASAEVRGLNGFHVEHVVLTNQRQRHLVVKVGALPTDVLLFLGAQLHRFLAAGGLPPVPGYPPLCGILTHPPSAWGWRALSPL